MVLISSHTYEMRNYFSHLDIASTMSQHSYLYNLVNIHLWFLVNRFFSECVNPWDVEMTCEITAWAFFPRNCISNDWALAQVPGPKACMRKVRSQYPFSKLAAQYIPHIYYNTVLHAQLTCSEGIYRIRT